MSCSNRELVEFFLSHRLSQRNYPTCLLRRRDVTGRTDRDRTNATVSNGLLGSNSRGATSQPPCDDVEAVKAALLESADEFELRFTQAFSNLTTQIDITPDTAYHSFKSVIDEVFKNGVNWGRIVGLFCFGGVLCVECVEKGMTELVSRIADWMTMYLDENISPWIESQGGWETFAVVFGQDAIAEARRARETMWRWLLTGVSLLTGVLIGVFIAKRQ